MKMQFFASLCLPPPPLKVSFVLCDVIKDLNSDTHIEHTINHRVNNVNSTEIAEGKSDSTPEERGSWYYIIVARGAAIHEVRRNLECVCVCGA